MRVTLVGLGPGPREWITPAAINALRSPQARVFARTRHFPGLSAVLADREWESFDDLYETAASLDDVHRQMVERLLSAGDEVVLAVPGDGTIGEAIVAALLEKNTTIEVVPGIA